ncbi:hypothetical protein MY11210_000853 [Beauveria gryllotalpidicola]
MADTVQVTRLPPPSGTHTHTVVFLHGRGDNTTNFIASLARSRSSHGQTLLGAFPNFRWVFPQAPVSRCARGGATWPQWFDVWDPRDFAAREELQVEGLRAMVPAIARILADEAAALGGQWDRVILAGISMGAATSVHTLFNLDLLVPEAARLGAFMGFAGRCPFAGRSLAGMREVLGLRQPSAPAHYGGGGSVLANTPMLLEHCVDDPLVLVQNGRGLRDVLTGFGAKVAWKEYPSGGHWFNAPAGMDDAIAFLNEVLRQSK